MSLWRSRWAMPLLFLLTFLVRVSVQNWARVGGDESFYWSTCRAVAHFQALPLLGPEVSGSAARLPGPGLYLIGAPPFLLFSGLRAGSLYVALLHALGGLLVARLARAARGDRAGVIAFLAVAFAPWDILYGDRFWPSCLTPIVATCALYAAARSHERPKALGWATGLAVFLPQLHLSVPALWAAMLVLVVLRPPPRFPWRAVAVGLLVGALSYVPYLIHELPNGFSNTKLLFANAQGKIAPELAWTLPAKVAITALLYGSAEIGYHFQRGYWAWAGGFDEVQAYLSLAGWQASLQRLGPLLFAGTLLSLLASAAAWVLGLGRALPTMVERWRQREEPALEHALTLALAAGFLAAALLLFLGKKPFFPHYANVLMPAALWPLAMMFDRAASLAWGRSLAVLLGLSSVLSAGVALYRYYGQIDALNGLGPTLSMVERVLAEPEPVRLSFRHISNEYAWQQIANGSFGRSLALSNQAPVHYTVHNDRPHQGPLPEGGTLYGPVLLVRSPPVGDGRAPASPLIAGWRQIQIRTRCDDGRTGDCRPAGPRCDYGDQPWQHFGPERLPIGGQEVPVLFLHPITGCTVVAEIPAALAQGQLRYALSDPALASSNTAPIELTLRRGEAVRTASTARTPGFQSLALPPGDGPVTLELRVSADGARVFGFDLAPSPDPRPEEPLPK